MTRTLHLAFSLALFAIPATAQDAPSTTQATPPALHSAAPIEERPPAAVFKVNTRLVNVFVNATGADGSPLGSLDRSDFRLLDDGQPQKLAVFERQSATPLSVSLAIDTSGSMIKDARLVRDAARQFIGDVIQPDDEMQVLQFAQTVDELAPFTSDPRRIDSALRNLTEGETTHMYDAVYLAAQGLASRRVTPSDGVRKRVIVLITDGGDSGLGTSYDRAVEQALRAEAMIFSIIIVPIPADAGRNTGGEHALIQMALDTGGKYYYAESSAALKDAFTHISSDLRTQYLLGYYAPPRKPDSNFHAITVQLTDPARHDDSLRYRTGYYEH